MDARRRLRPLLLSACFALALPAPTSAAGMRPIPDPAPPMSGPAAIAAANRTAWTPSRPDRFSDSLQVFDYAPGRIYEVWTSPLRVTTLSLSPGETVSTLAAGDTLRWQIAEAASGEGAARQVHILVKPLVQGLETNLVLASSRRIYLVALRSGAAATINTAVAWTSPDLGQTAAPRSEPAPAAWSEPLATLDSAYRIEVRGRRPAWAPVAALSDGHRTLIVFPPGVLRVQAPAVFALSAEGRPEMVNSRLAGDIYVVDGVVDRLELRIGPAKRPAVRISRRGASS